MSARSHIALLAVVLASAGCPELPPTSRFGVGCTSSSDCDDATLMCRPDPVDQSRRCLPPRLAAEPGESCTAPLSIGRVATADDTILLDETVFFGGAVDDADVACGVDDTAPDVVIRFTVTPRAGDLDSTPQGVAIEAPAGVAVELRTPGCDGAAVRFGCAAPAQTAFIAELPPGDYDLVIDGSVPGAGTIDEVGARVVVSRIDCPTGGLPFDNERCLRPTVLPAMREARVNHTAHAPGDGSLIVVGGNDDDSVHGTIEVLDEVRVRWKYANLAAGRAGHASAIVDDDLIAVGGIESRDDLNLSQVRLPSIDLPEEHARVVSTTTAGRIFGPTRAVAALGENSRLLVVSSDFDESGVFELDRRTARTCTRTVFCNAGERCLAEAGESTGICVCLSGACADARAIVHDIAGDLRLVLVEGTAMALVGDSVALVSGLDGLALGTIDFGGTLAIADLGGTTRRHAAIVPVDPRQALVLGGEDADGKALDTIIEVDVALNVARTLPFTLPRPVARPRATLVDDAIVILDDTDTPIVIGLDGAVRPAPVLPGRVGSVVVRDGNRIVAIGGREADGRASRRVDGLELVPRRAPPTPPLPGCAATPLPDDGVISGNTLIDDDTFRSQRCDQGVLFFGRDTAFTFEVTEPTSIRIVDVEVESPQTVGYRFVLLRGDCEQYEEVACGNSDDELAMFVPELEPGSYTLVAEFEGFGDDDDGPFGGAPFSARVLRAGPLACPIDERDPADDVVPGAAWVSSADSLVLASGRLCPGDVDRLLIEHWGGRGDLETGDLPNNEFLLQRAVIDEAASVAAGVPIASGVVGDPLESLQDAPAGFYLLTIEAAEDAVDFVSWEIGHFPSCVADDGDSLVPGLDDRVPARAPTMTPGTTLERNLCDRSDVDLIILSPGAGDDAFVTLDATFDVAVFTLDGEALGAPHPFTITPVGFDDMRVDLGVLPGPVAMRLSLPETVDQFSDIDSRIGFNQRQPGDACSNAVPLRDDDARTGQRFIDAAAFNDDHNAIEIGDCTGFRSPGKDVVFAVELQPGQTLNASILGRNDTDVNVYLLDRCPTPGDLDVCVVGDDEAGRGGADDISFTHSGAAAATYFLVLDSFFGEDWTGDLGWSIVGP